MQAMLQSENDAVKGTLLTRALGGENRAMLVQSLFADWRY